MLEFSKMQGLGNDFICMIYDENIKYNLKIFSRFLCDRHYGIGADGLILISRSRIADLKMRIFNSDGTEAEMCGNGIRCLARFAYEKKLIDKEKIYIETLGGIKEIQYILENKKVMAVKVNMGRPTIIPSKIPVYLPRGTKLCQGLCKVLIKNRDIDIVATCLSVGNPHAVIKVNNVKNYNVEQIGKLIENYKYFPNKTNVEFVEIINKNNIKMRVWERGDGETLSCGTGATAATYAFYKNGDLDNKVKVELLGGNLDIEIDKNTENIYMTGPAINVYEGKIDF